MISEYRKQHFNTIEIKKNGNELYNFNIAPNIFLFTK